MKRIRCGLIFLVLLLGAVSPSTASSEDFSNEALRTTDLGDIVINSRSFEWRIKEKAVVFIEEVTARKKGLTINCDKIRVDYSESENGNMDYDRILATGNVRITRPDGGLVEAEEAVYVPSEDKVVMTGQPVFKQGKNSFQGTRITFFSNEEHIMMEGPVRAIQHDEGVFINSESFKIDNKKKIFVFSGKVELRRKDMIMNCEKMIGYYNEKSTERDVENAESLIGNIERIIATDRVRMARTDGLSGTAEKALYDFAEEKVVMTGQPVFRQGKDIWKGSSLTYYLREELVTGTDVRAVLHQKKEEGDFIGG
jgi:lipopolysaccharide export system protein LptA